MKRRARIEARVSRLKRKESTKKTSGEAEAVAVAVAPAASHVRKLQKRVRFLDRVKTSALAARAAVVFKRKRKAQGKLSLGVLVRTVCGALPAHGTARRVRADASAPLIRRTLFRSWKAFCRRPSRRLSLSSCRGPLESFTSGRVSSALPLKR